MGEKGVERNPNRPRHKGISNAWAMEKPEGDYGGKGVQGTKIEKGPGEQSVRETGANQKEDQKETRKGGMWKRKKGEEGKNLGKPCNIIKPQLKKPNGKKTKADLRRKGTAGRENGFGKTSAKEEVKKSWKAVTSKKKNRL